MQTWKHTLLLAIAAITIAMGLRLIFIAESQQFPDFRTPAPGMDLDLHWNAARLLQRRPVLEPAFELRELSAPFNVRFLSLSQRVLGQNLLAHRFLYAGLGALASGLLFGFVLRCSGRPNVALAAALLLGIQPTWIYISTIPLKSSFTVLLGVALLWAAWESTQARTTISSVLLAVLHFLIGSLLFLTQGNTAFMWVVTTGFLVVAGPSTARRRVAIGIALATCFLAASAIRLVLGDLRPGPLGVPQGGIHARLGFHPGATGCYTGIRGIPATPTGHTFIARMAAEIEAGRPLTFAQSNAHHWKAALDSILADPSRAARLSGRKFMLFFNDFAPNENYFLDELRSRSRILASIPVGFGLLVVCASWGVVALIRRSRWDLLVLLSGAVSGVLAANLATFVTSRYRISAIAPLAVLGAIGLSFAVDSIRGRRAGGTPLRTIITDVLVPGLAAALIAFGPVISDNERRSALRTAKVNLHRSELAEPLVLRLSAINTKEAIPYNSLKEHAFLLLRLQRLTEAYQEMENMVAQKPNDSQVTRQLLAMTVVYGDYEKAIILGRKCRNQFGWNDADFLNGQEESVTAILRQFILPHL